MLFLRIDDTHISLLDHSQTSISDEGKDSPYLFERRALRPSLTLEANLQELQATHPEFQATQQVEVVISSPTTVVPLAEFEEEEIVELYYYTVLGENEPRASHRIHYDLLPASNAVLLFSIQEEVCQAIESVFGEVHYVSSITGWLKRFSTKINVHQRRRVYLHCEEEQVEIAIFEGHNLLMLNRNEIKTPADAAYYALNVAQSLGLDLQQVPISLFGYEKRRDAVEKELSLFVSNVGVIRLSAEFNRHPLTQIPNIPFDLATQILNQ